MSASADTTLVFVNWNTGELLLAAVESLLAVMPPGDHYPVVVVDNGSTDDSVARTRAAASAWPTARVTLQEVHEMGRNAGFAAAVNQGLALTHTPYAVILNTDVTFRNDAVPRLVGALREWDNAALAAPRLFRPNGSEQRAPTPLPTLTTELTNRSAAQRRLLDSLPAGRTGAVPAVLGCVMAVDCGRVAEVGGLDEGFFFYFEETDLCKRLGDAGYAVLWVPAAEMVHLGGGSTEDQRRDDAPDIRSRVQFADSRRRYFRKHFGDDGVAALDRGLVRRYSLAIPFMKVLALLPGKIGRKHRRKLAEYVALRSWHRRGCPPGEGYAPTE